MIRMTGGVEATLPPTAKVTGPAYAAANGRLWRVAGWLLIAHIVLMLGSFSLQRIAPLGAPSAVVVADHVRWSMAKGFSGGYLTALSFLVFVAFAMLLARLLRGHTETSGWLSATVGASAVIYTASTFTGLAALGAALYDGHHGAPLPLVTALDHLHWFAIFLATAALGMFILALAAAVRVTDALPRWVASTGFVAGAVCIAAVPGARVGLVDVATLVWVVWFVAFGVAALRRGRNSVSVLSQASARG